MKTIIFICLSSLFLAGSVQLSAQTPVPQENSKKDPKGAKRKMVTMKVKISGMTCANGCAKGIEDKVYQMKGIKSSTVNFEEMIGTFIFDETKITKEQIISAIENFNSGENGDHKYKTEVISLEPK